MENTNNEQIVTAPIEGQAVKAKKPSKAGAIFWGLLVIFIYLTIVSIPQVVVMMPMMAEAVLESGGDMMLYSDILMRKMTAQADAITISTVIGTAAAVVVYVLWYFFGVYKKNLKNGTHESVLPKLKNGKSIAFILFGSMAAYCVTQIVMDLTMSIMPVIGEAYAETMGAVLGGVEILGYILAVVLAPIGEEVCLRGIVMNRARKSYGLVGCMVLSGILFGVYHLNPIQGIYAIPTGIFLGFLAYKYKSVVPCMIAHFINNIFSMCLSLVSKYQDVVLLILLVVFGAVAVYLGLRIDFFREKNS